MLYVVNVFGERTTLFPQFSSFLLMGNYWEMFT